MIALLFDSMGLFFSKSKKNKPHGGVTVDEKLTHIAFIMDGNGRWAKKRSLPRSAGHAAGAKTFKDIARYCNKIGIKYLLSLIHI